ncbi:MAG: OmpA family protein [Bacteroidaceae bacterium]|nr:OmpA family protein [Bacteroidaceae bacterium]MCI6803406.1 OmpA family protein [Prevotellaceae bacterium]
MVCACSNEGVAFKKAEQSYAIGEYYAASINYKKSYSRCTPKEKDKRAVRAFMMGECYRHIGYTQKAMAAYTNAIRYNIPDSMAYLHLGRQQLKAGQYKQAAQNFNQYLEFDPSNELARSGLLSCELGPQWKAKPNQYKIKKEAVFNSRRSDYSPMLVGDDADQLVLSSTRKEAAGDDISGITGLKFGDLFFSRKNEQGKWQPVDVIEGEVNTEYDEGASCLSPDGKTMYFTRCSSDPDYPRYAEIWQSQRSDASWSKPTKCVISRDTLTSFAHPAVSPDGQWLYFVSDAQGGEGGLDIWRTRILESGFGGMENLGRPINTAGDEMFPSFRPNGDLYFSSDGHPGMGGLDIFIAHEDSIRGTIVENQQYPLNSSADDFGMTFEGVHNRGYFSSSRNDGKGWEHIFSFECPEILQTVTGWVYEKDGYELPEALVYMVGNDGTNLKLSVKGDGSFTQVLKPDVDYVLLGTCKGYLNVKNEIRVEDAEESHEYTLQFPLPPINVPVLIDNIFYEFDRADLTPESTEALDKLVEMMNENPNITIELSAHCDYRGNDDYNQRLSQRRAESVVRYLIQHGVARDRLTAVGYGESRPKIITKKLAETLLAGDPKVKVHETDTLTETYILAFKDEDAQEVLNALNRRTEFRVLRTTYGTTLNEYKPEEEEKKAAAKRKEEAEEEENFIF